MSHPLLPELDAAQIAAHLSARSPRFVIDVLHETPSTNAELVNAAAPPLGHMRVCAARHQSAGRGRRGRGWLSRPRQSLTFSCSWQLPAHEPVPTTLPLVAGLALAQALESLGAPAPRLKWPNDVLLDGRKLAGILVELNNAAGKPAAAVIGLGLNLAFTPDTSATGGLAATDLYSHLAARPDPNKVLARILENLYERLQRLATEGFTAMRKEWEARNAFAGQAVLIADDGHRVRGICRGIDEDGALRIDTADGCLRILSGDISVRNAA